MNKLFWYKLTSLGLLTLNISILLIFFLNKPSRPHMPPPPGNNVEVRAEVARILHLNEKQKETFVEMASEHHRQLALIKEKQYEKLAPIFDGLVEENNESMAAKDSLMKEFERLESEKIQITYQHFREVRKLLNEDQMVYYEEFMQRVLNIFFRKSQKDLEPPKEFEK